MELRIENLTKAYGRKVALRNFTATLSSGIYGLLGPNGAGKSTMMKILTENLSADKGQILVDGIPSDKLGADYRALLGYMPQQQGLYPHFTARRFLYYIAGLKGMTKSRATEEVERAAAMVNMTEYLDKRLGTYSGGMKQRILIAQAVLGSPKILILDEPTAGLDPKERIRIRNLISQISMDRIVILATHVVSDVEYIAKEILMLKDGCLISQLRPSALLQQMKGKVFEICVPEDRVEEVQSRYLVGNIRKDETDRIWARVIGNQKPNEAQAQEVMPTLEDVYLYTFEERMPEGGSL
ncbi:MAG: ABC transporter ATP-binding protein [Oscillospiraceae bacterium]|nr:ABC transporter ATP-binding protein [Oscillospiraceae bacterium]